MVGKGQITRRFPPHPFSFEKRRCYFLHVKAFYLSLVKARADDDELLTMKICTSHLGRTPARHPFLGHGGESVSLCVVLRLRNMLPCEHIFETDIWLMLILILILMLWVTFLELLTKLLWLTVVLQDCQAKVFFDLLTGGGTNWVCSGRGEEALPFGCGPFSPNISNHKYAPNDVCALL